MPHVVLEPSRSLPSDTALRDFAPPTVSTLYGKGATSKGKALRVEKNGENKSLSVDKWRKQKSVRAVGCDLDEDTFSLYLPPLDAKSGVLVSSKSRSASLVSKTIYIPD